jgi:FtsZ-binding cell division protein ZapB
LAELYSQYTAKIAAREIALKEEIAKCASAGEEEKAEEARQNLNAERKKLQSELEGKKERIRSGGNQ